MLAREIEFKWKVSGRNPFYRLLGALTALGGAVSAPAGVFNRDYYLDTPCRRFEAAQTACRVRASGGKYELFIKSASKVKNGLAQRKEYSARLKAGNIKEAASAGIEILRRRFRMNQAPAVVFKIFNRRSCAAVSFKGMFEAEACHDNARIFAAGRSVPLKEIEFEYKDGNLALFKKTARKASRLAGLSPVKISKVATARALLRGKQA